MLKIDCHTHVMDGNPALLIKRSAQSGVDRLNVLGVPVLCGAGNNFECLMVKKLRPEAAYCFGGLVWQGKRCPSPEEQLRLIMEAGFDGLKLIETKPTVQKERGFHPQDELFEAMFALAEQERFPILWHVGDPAAFWSLDTAPAFAVENGWTYEKEGFLPLAELYHETEEVLKRHPRLCLVLAHFYFCSDDAGHIEGLLNKYSGLSVDITPGVEMYQNFAQNPAFWQSFFEKYSNRILMGSDMTDEAADTYYEPIGRIIRGMLSPDPFEVWDIKTNGLRLSQAALENIWSRNFIRLCGHEPKPINHSGLSNLMRFYETRLDADNADAAKKAYEEAVK